MILVTREQANLNDLAALDTHEVDTPLFEFYAIDLASELQRDGDPVAVGHVLVSTRDAESTFRCFHHVADHLTHCGQAFVRARKTIFTGLMPNHIGRKNSSKNGLITGLDRFDIGLPYFDVSHVSLSNLNWIAKTKILLRNKWMQG